MSLDVSKYVKSKKNKKITKIKRYIFKYIPFFSIVMMFLPFIALEYTKNIYVEILIYSSFGTGIILLILYSNSKLISRCQNIRNIKEKKELEEQQKLEEIRKEKITQNNNDSCAGCGCLLIVIIALIALFANVPWWAAVIILLLLLR